MTYNIVCHNMSYVTAYVNCVYFHNKFKHNHTTTYAAIHMVIYALMSSLCAPPA